MQVSKDKVVSFHYKVFEGEVLLENSHDGDPLVYLHGKGGILKALQDTLDGHNSGDQVEVTLSPEQAYGRRKDNAEDRVPIKYLLNTKKPKKGDVVRVNTNHGAKDVVVLKVGRFNVDVDTNHPLAGKTLRFKLEVKEVRDASAEELSHGHAHGPGGHQH